MSPSGTPPPVRESWVHNVTWARGNALEPRTCVEYSTACHFGVLFHTMRTARYLEWQAAVNASKQATDSVNMNI